MKHAFGAKAGVVLSMMALVCPLLLGDSAWAGSKQFTSDFRIEECDFDDGGRNAYFSLVTGDVLTFQGGGVDLTITVLNETKEINFTTAHNVEMKVKTRVIEERESVDGRLFETSRNYYARCKQTNDIYYFGEDVVFADGTSGGSWLAGKDGALPGVIMPGTFLLGARYFQEVAPNVALDRAEHVAMGLSVTAAGKTFHDCVQVFETTPLEPQSKSTKIYCPGIGLVNDNGLPLVDYDIAP